MSLVLVEKFNFVDMLRNIDRYRISHLMLVMLVHSVFLDLNLSPSMILRLVPPHIVLFCKVDFERFR